MTDAPAIAPIDIPGSNLGRRKSDLTLGTLLVDMFVFLGDAFNMAYVAPYTGHQRRPQAVADNDLEGRDPRW
jgi:hypothetical protein